jgi:hypothetical protein
MSDDPKAGEQEFLYDAFISYRHVERDRKWAEWLISALESYHVPKTLQERGLPPRLRKIFRDEDELPSSADLNDQIRAALVASRFLIVVCSAFTPRSKWVQREIELFNELGRGDQVLALLTEGEPADSFPDAMLVRTREVADSDGTKRTVKEDKEPLAADVRPRSGVSTETSKRLALMRLVAVILGVKFDELRQREHQRERKRRLTWAAIAAGIVLLVGAGGGAYWNIVKPKTTYYRDMVWRRGVPEGAYQIDAATHDGLAGSYSVITRGGKIVEARYDGYRRRDADGQARWVVHYGDNGAADQIEIFAPNGRLIRDNILHREAANKMIVSFERYGVPLAQDSTQNLITDLTKLDPGSAQAKTLITRQEQTFDDQGFATDVRYQDNWGIPQHDAQGSFGEHFSYTPQGLVLRRAQTGPDGAEITLKNGVHAVTSEYDGHGRLVQLTLIGEDGRPINGPNGYASYMREYEPQGAGNNISQTYYDADARPTLSSDGYSKLVGQHDERGDNTEVAYFGIDGKPIVHKDGFATIRRKFDERSNIIEEAYFDADGKPTYDAIGRAGYRAKFDVHGNIVEVDNYGADGKPIISKQGFVKLRRVVDEHGNIVDEFYRDTEGKLMAQLFGHAEMRQKFDGHDNRTELAFFDAKGNATLSKENIARAEYTYDVRGNEIKREFFGVDGKPISSSDNEAGYRQTFDDRGNLLEQAVFGLNGEPLLSKAIGSADLRYKYDDQGRNIEVDYFGTDGKPILVPGGYASVRYTYDARGNQIEMAYFGIDGTPKFDNQHIAAFKYTYDSRGNTTEARFFGVDGQPTLAAGGQAGYRQKFDNQGNIVEGSYFDLAGKPTMYSPGYAGYRSKFDHQHHNTETVYFGTAGQPIAAKTGVAKITSSYDERGHRTAQNNFGVDNKPTLVEPSGWSSLRQDYDERGNVVSETYFGVDGKPVALPNGGFAKITWIYNARGQVTTTSYFGPDGMPAHNDGCVTINYSYDDFGQQTKVTYLDSQGREMQMELTIHGIAPGGQAARVGLAIGDHVLTYNGTVLTSTKQLVDLEAGSGYRSITVRRGDHILSFDVRSGRLDADLDLVNVSSNGAANARGSAPALH